jgi:Cu+-exporting ATPase
MALEPVDSRSDEENPELALMTKRFWFSAALSAPVFAVSMAEMVPGFSFQGLASARTLNFV